MAFDRGRGSADRDRLNYVRIQSPLYQKADSTNPCSFFFEDLDEKRSNRFRLVSGSTTSFKASRKRWLASIPWIFSFSFCFSKARVDSNSPSRNNPLFMNRQT